MLADFAGPRGIVLNKKERRNSAVRSRDHYFLHPQGKEPVPGPGDGIIKHKLRENSKTSSDNKRVFVRERCVCEERKKNYEKIPTCCAKHLSHSIHTHTQTQTREKKIHKIDETRKV